MPFGQEPGLLCKDITPVPFQAHHDLLHLAVVTSHRP
jgi:hypothetical protein